MPVAKVYSRALLVSSAFITPVALTSVPASAAAQSAAQSPQVRLNVPAQELATALSEYARQSGQQLFYSPALVRGKRASPVSGTFTPDAGLNRLLSGTGIIYRRTRSGTYVLTQASSRSKTSTSQTEPPAAGANDDGNREGPPVESSSRPRAEIGEIVVVGSRLGSGDQSAQPTRVIARDEIERSGALGVAQVLNRLPEVSVSNDGTLGGNFSAGATTVQLRGLPFGTTLVLLNGRRVANTSSFPDMFDLSSIPLDFVERIEVLPNGSSAVYGGDALAGVVNVVFRKDISGIQGAVRYGLSDGYHDVQGSLGAGHVWSRGSVSLVGSYSTNNGLHGSERALTADQDYTRFGGFDERTTVSNPANIRTANGALLPGLNSSFATVPVGSSGIGLTPSSFAATAGTRNLTSFRAFSFYVVPQKRYGALLNFRYDLAPAVELFSETLYSHNWASSKGGSRLGIFNALVPASNAFNPFGVNLRTDFLLEAPSFFERKQQYVRPLVGLKGPLTNDLRWEIAGWLGRDKVRDEFNSLNSAAVASALASSDPATALNVFQNGPGGSDDLIRSLQTFFIQKYSTHERAVNGFITGSLFELPSGPLEVVAGAEHIGSTLKTVSLPEKADRDSSAAFAEVKLPLISADWSPTGSLVNLSGAVRYDHYSDFGGRASWGAGAEIRPLAGLLLRGAYSTAFKPPTLIRLNAPQSTITIPISDRLLNEVYFTTLVSGGNPDLKPQTGESRTLGFVYSPSFLKGVRVGVTSWRVHLKNAFAPPSIDFLLANPNEFPGRVIRDPVTQRVTLINRTVANFGFIKVGGLDFTLDGRIDTPLGTLSPSFYATRTNRYDVLATPGGRVRNAVNQADFAGYAPRWKATGGLSWSSRDDMIHTGLTGRYVGKYRDYFPFADDRTNWQGNDLFIDVDSRIDLTRLLGGMNLLKKTYVNLGVVNVLDKAAEYSDNGGLGYDPSQYDIRGRYAYTRLSTSF